MERLYDFLLIEILLYTISRFILDIMINRKTNLKEKLSYINIGIVLSFIAIFICILGIIIGIVLDKKVLSLIFILILNILGAITYFMEKKTIKELQELDVLSNMSNRNMEDIEEFIESYLEKNK